MVLRRLSASFVSAWLVVLVSCGAGARAGADVGPHEDAILVDAEPLNDADLHQPADADRDAADGTVEVSADEICVPDCTGKVCGDDDGCHGMCTGCPGVCGGAYCEGGYCVALCACNCDNKECGDGGCGGGPTECGTCPEGVACCPSGRCGGDCSGRECGGDGCGGSCGTCGATTVCYKGACLDATWTDPETGFVWQTVLETPSMDWYAAFAYCHENASGLPGVGWRLPNVSELRTLIHDCEGTVTEGPCGVVDVCAACGTAVACLAEGTCFDGTTCRMCEGDFGGPGLEFGCYGPVELKPACSMSWSSSAFADVPDYAWTVSLGDGVVFGQATEQYTWVRCVRSGP